MDDAIFGTNNLNTQFTKVGHLKIINWNNQTKFKKNIRKQSIHQY